MQRNNRYDKSTQSKIDKAEFTSRYNQCLGSIFKTVSRAAQIEAYELRGDRDNALRATEQSVDLYKKSYGLCSEFKDYDSDINKYFKP